MTSKAELVRLHSSMVEDAEGDMLHAEKPVGMQEADGLVRRATIMPYGP